MEDDVLGIRATIDASDVQKSANDFIKAIQNMAKVSDDEVNKMADGYGFLMSQINQLADAIDAAKGKLTSISGAMSNIAPKDVADTQAYEDLKAQVDALTQVNDGLKAKLNEATANIAEQAKTAGTATDAMRELDAASQSMGNNNLASISAKSKGEMKELADGIAFLTQQINLANQEYQKLAQSLDELQQKKQNISKSNIRTESFYDANTGETQTTSKESAMQEVDTQIAQTQAKMTSLKDVIAQNRDEITNCSQRMAELGNQTSQTATKTATLRTQLRNARQHVAEMILGGQQNTIEFGKAVNEANKLQAAFAKSSMAINGKNLAFNSFNMMSTAINGVTGALTTYMGVASIFTDDQEKLAKIQKDLQAVMSVSMGVQQLMTAATQIGVKWDTLKASALATVTAAEAENSTAQGVNTATSAAGTVAAGAQTAANWTLATSFKAVSLAIKQIPVIGWIIAGITALIAAGVALYNWFTKLTPAEEAARDANKAFDEQIKKNRETMLNQANEVGKTIVKYKQLRNQYMEVRSDAKKLDEFIQDNQNSFDELGVSVSNATDAEKVFNTMSDIVEQGFRLRAKAAAQAQVAIENYTEAYRLQLQAEGWEGSAKYGSSRHSKEDQAKALAKAKAMRDTADRLERNGDKAIADSQKTEQQYRQHMKGVPLATDKKTTKTTGKSTGGGHSGGGSGTSEKSQAEINYENNLKWEELNVKMAEKYNDVIKQIAEERLAMYEDNAEKELAQITKETNEKKLAVKKEIDELAKAYKETRKETWINAKKGRTEFQWSQTAEGKKDDQYWVDEMFKRYPKLSKQYEDLYNVINESATHQQDELIDKIISQYEKNTNQSKKEQLSKYDSEIRVLQNQLLGDMDDFKRKDIQTTIDILKNQKEWLQGSKDIWNEYYTKYGNFVEKKKALDDKFAHDTVGLEETNPRYLSLKNEYDAAKSTLEAEELLKDFNWMDSVTNWAKISSDALEEVKQKLIAIIDANKELNAQDKLKIVDKINKIQGEEDSRKGSFFKGSVIGTAIDNRAERERLKQDFEQKKKVYEQEKEKYDKAIAESTKAQALKGEKENELNNFLQQNGSSINASQLQGMDTQQAMEMLKNAGVDTSKFGDGFSSMLQGFNGASQGAEAAASQASQAATAMQGAGQAMQGAEAAMGGGGGGGGAAMAEAIIKTVNQNVQSLNELVKKFGDEDSDFAKGMNDFAYSSNEAVSAMESFKSGDFMGVVLHLSNAFESLGSSLAHFFGYNDGERAYKKELEHYQKLSGIWSDLIDKKSEYVNMSWGDGAKKAIKEVESLYAAEEKATKSTLQAFLNKKSWNAHSQSYRNTQAINDAGGFAKWSSLSGVNISQIEDLYQKNYTYDQLVALKGANNGEFWGALGEEVRKYLDSLIDCKKGTEDFKETALEKLTGVKFDDMYSNFMDALGDMSKGADDFVSDFKNQIRSAIVQNVLGDKVKDWIKDFTKRYQDAVEAGGGTISEATKQGFIDELKEFSNNTFEERKQITENLGLGASSTDSTEKGGYATASEESIEELSGRALATNEALYSIRDQQQLDASTLTGIGSTLQNLVVIETNRNAYYDESIDIQRTSVSHLAAIEKNTYNLFAMSEKLTKIEKNTRNM